MDKKQIIVLVSLSIVMLILGGVFGFGLAKNGTPLGNIVELNKLCSKTISSITAAGEIKKIEVVNDVKKITIDNEGEILTVLVPDNTRLSSLATVVDSKTKKETPVRETIKFDALKVGESVNLTLKVSPDNQLSAVSITLLVKN